MSNGLLLNPEQDMHGRRVLATVKFKNKNEFGETVESTKPQPATEAEDTKYYFCSIMNAQMHRPDGKKIAFINGVCATNLYWDQVYLDNEIADGHPCLSYATSEQIDSYKFSINPKAAIREQIEAEVEQALSVKIENRLRKKMGLEPVEGTSFEPEQSELEIAEATVAGETTDAEKLAGTGTGTVTDRLAGVRNRAATVSEIATPAPILKGIASTQSSDNKAGSA